MMFFSAHCSTARQARYSTKCSAMPHELIPGKSGNQIASMRRSIIADAASMFSFAENQCGGSGISVLVGSQARTELDTSASNTILPGPDLPCCKVTLRTHL